jgi:hypothetical protein
MTRLSLVESTNWPRTVSSFGLTKRINHGEAYSDGSTTSGTFDPTYEPPQLVTEPTPNPAADPPPSPRPSALALRPVPSQKSTRERQLHASGGGRSFQFDARQKAAVYCQAVLSHDQRIGLDGLPAEMVDAAARDLATKQLAQLAACEATKKAAGAAAAAVAEPKPAPKRPTETPEQLRDRVRAGLLRRRA